MQRSQYFFEIAAYDDTPTHLIGLIHRDLFETFDELPGLGRDCS